MTTTYILAGYDYNGAFEKEMAAWEARAREPGKDPLVIIRPGAGEAISQTLRRIHGPANIILAAHGDNDSSFTWAKDSQHYYTDLFAALPRTGIESITIQSCYAESAQVMLSRLPTGTILQSVIGAKVIGYAESIGEAFAKEIGVNSITPLAIMLEALDNTDPAEFKRRYDEWVMQNPQEAKKRGITAKNYHSNDVLPHMIGIGGKPPIQIDLNEKMVHISALGKAAKLDGTAFDSATALVKQHFDTNAGQSFQSLHNGTKTAELLTVDKSEADEHGAAEAALKSAIDSVAHKLSAGADISRFTLKEKRIAYAITVAYLYEDGTIARDIEKSHAVKPIRWKGTGDETIAKIQAVLERVYHLSSDTDGPADDRVNGLLNKKTRAYLMQRSGNPDVPGNKERFLQALLYNPDVQDILGTATDARGEPIANIVLQRPQRAPHTK